jgi:hypothetical protein
MPARGSRSMRIKWVFPGSDRPHKSIWANLMLSGEVTVTGRRGTVTLKQGQGTMLFGDGKPQRAAAWPAGRMKRAVASITFGKPSDRP